MPTEITYRLHHFGLLCQDMDQSLGSYHDHFGSQLTSRWYNRGLLDISFLGRGSDATVELVAAPFMPYEESFLDRHGYGINHLSFLVDDAGAAYEELKAQGVRVAWEPKRVLELWQCGFYDEDGLLFEVFNPLDPANPLATPEPIRAARPDDLSLNHVSLLTPDLRQAERFYTDKLGMKTVLEFREDGGGFVLLADRCFDPETHNFTLEIVGPPGLEPREQAMLEKHGACLDHLCYAAEDVQSAWQATLARGAPNAAAPVQAYGTRLAWVKDADGNDVEIMNPYPAERLRAALVSGAPIEIS